TMQAVTKTRRGRWSLTSTTSANLLRLLDLLEHRRDVFAELGRVLAHREMPKLFHDGDLAAWNTARRPQRVLRRAGEIIFAGEQIERTDLGVDLLDPSAQVAVDAVEIQIALEDAPTALLVAP